MLSLTSHPATLHSIAVKGHQTEKGDLLAKVRLIISYELDGEQLADLSYVGEACEVLLASSNAQDPDKGANTMTLRVKRPFTPQNLEFAGGSLEETVCMNGAQISLQPAVRIVDGCPSVRMTIDGTLPTGLLEPLAGMVDHDKVQLTMSSAQGTIPFDGEATTAALH